MRRPEADWIREQLLTYGPERASPILNIGSQTADYREKQKPHIEERLFRPLREAGFVVIHSDLQAAPGVDLVGDVTETEFQRQLKTRHVRAILNNNLFEHLAEPGSIAEACEEIVGGGGLIFVTVPHSYPYHPDPIDTLYRPSPQELVSLFGRSNIVGSRIITDGNYLSDSLNRGIRGVAHLLGRLGYRAARTLFRPWAIKRELHWVLWFVRKYKISCAVLEVRRSA